MENRPEFCFECGKGHYIDVFEDYKCYPPNESLVIPNVLFLKCDKCGEECLPPKSQKQIDLAIKKYKGKS